MKNDRNVYKEVTDFVEHGWACDGNFNFTAGVLESVLINALEQLPRGKREVLLDRLIAVDAKYFTKKKVSEERDVQAPHETDLWHDTSKELA
jgi:hypothetical protein